MQADWSALPPVGGISIIETFDLALHPLRLQIERSMGRRILHYIFAGHGHSDGDPQQLEIPDSGTALHSVESPSGSNTPTVNRPRASLESVIPTTASAIRRRSPSIQNPRSNNLTPTTERTDKGFRRLRKVSSSDYLASKKEGDDPGKGSRGPRNAVDAEVEQMRWRASRNRTFLHIRVARLALRPYRLWTALNIILLLTV
jgi:hypothetical protein